MWDLIAATFVLLGLSCLAFLAGLRLAAEATPSAISTSSRTSGPFSWRRFLAQLLYAVLLATLLLYVFRYHGTWQMARLVPFSGAIILTNWIPPAGAFLAASVLRQRAAPLWRRAGLAILILFVSFYSLLVGLLLPGPTATPSLRRQASPMAQSADPAEFVRSVLRRNSASGSRNRRNRTGNGAALPDELSRLSGVGIVSRIETQDRRHTLGRRGGNLFGRKPA